MSSSCARCGAPGTVVAYFGPTFCGSCARAAADYFDSVGKWPPLPPEVQAELDALGPFSDVDDRQQLVETGSSPPPDATPEPCPPGVIDTATHPWVPCDVCGRGSIVALETATGNERKPPACRMTPGCPGHHTPNERSQAA